MNTSHRTWIIFALAVALFSTVALGAAPDAPPVGRLFELGDDDLAIDSGRWVDAGERPLIVLERAADLELSDGRRLRLDANSAVVLERTPRGLSVTVLSGRVRLNGEDGRELVGGAGGQFVLGRVARPLDERATAAEPAPIDDHDRRVRFGRGGGR